VIGSTERAGCRAAVYLDGKEVLQSDLDESNQFAFSGVLASSLANGDHEITISILDTPVGLIADVAHSQFTLAVGNSSDEDRINMNAAFTKSYSMEDACSPDEGNGAKKFASVSEIKSAVIFYHSNIQNVYPERWISKCIDTILQQTHQDFDIFELNYGGDEHTVFRWHLHKLNGRKYTFLSKRLDDHGMAMNFLLDYIFSQGYDAVFNTNLDDFYAPTRFARQVGPPQLPAHAAPKHSPGSKPLPPV
jgi:hypothetical protein